MQGIRYQIICMGMLLLLCASVSALAAAYDPIVYQAQVTLKGLGYNPGPLDGRAGKQTFDSITRFQRDNQLPVTGQLDELTLQALGINVPAVPPAIQTPAPVLTPAPVQTPARQSGQTAPRTQQQQPLYPPLEGESRTNPVRQVQRGDSTGHETSFVRRPGVGVWTSIMNFGIGPCVEFYPTRSLGVMGTVGALFDYTSYSVRGMYLLPSYWEIGDMPLYPYVGAGLTYVQGPEINVLGDKLEQHGTGFEVYGGGLLTLKSILPNLGIRTEFIYSNIDIKTTIEGEEYEYPGSTLEWGMFSVGLGMTYFF